jgi:hypothetical protein
MFTSEEKQRQLDEWLEGRSQHLGSPMMGGECVPDYSCCFPGLLASREEREAYYYADKPDRLCMGRTFLQRLIAAVNGLTRSVYVSAPARPSGGYQCPTCGRHIRRRDSESKRG